MAARQISILLALLLVVGSVHAYDTEDEVIVLTKNEFSEVAKQHPQMLIEIYAPWCGHCRKLAPIYAEAAQTLAKQNSKVKLAKLDDTTDRLDDERFKITGYPTLFYLDDDTVVKYQGERTAEAIVRWINKRTDPLVQVNSESDLDKVKNAKGTRFVLYSKNPSDIKKFSKASQNDLKNDYYVVTGGLASGISGTETVIYNDFGEPATLKGGLDSGFKLWAFKNERPAVVKADERTMQLLFNEHMTVVILFNPKKDSRFTDMLKEAANKFKSTDVIFSESVPGDENYDRITEFFGVDGKQPRLIAADGSMTQKAVFLKALSDTTSAQFNDFVQAVSDQTARLYNYDVKVPVSSRSTEL